MPDSWVADGVMLWNGSKVVIELEMPRWFTVKMATQQRRVHVKISLRYLGVAEELYLE